MNLVAKKESDKTVLQVEGLRKSFKTGVVALNNVTLEVKRGEMVALIGPSGSGKSTLIRHISGLEVSDPGCGMVKVMGRTVQANGRLAPQVRDIRARVGVIFQQFNLVGRLSVMTNVLMGSLHRVPYWRSMTCLFDREARERALAALERVGIAQHAWQRASTLSGGQQQRVAIARTLVQDPEIILADEPIASLDPESATNVMDLLSRINEEDSRTILVSLHQVEFALRYCARVVALKRGEIIYDGPPSSLTPKKIKAIYGTNCRSCEETSGPLGVQSFHRSHWIALGELSEEDAAWAGMEHELVAEPPEESPIKHAGRG